MTHAISSDISELGVVSHTFRTISLLILIGRNCRNNAERDKKTRGVIHCNEHHKAFDGERKAGGFQRDRVRRIAISNHSII